MKSFEEISEKYSTWIIKYSSTNFETPLYLVWYTDIDENRTDRLLTYTDGNIFSTNLLYNIKNTILSEINNLNVSENISSWLNNFDDLSVIESVYINNVSSVNSIDIGSIDIITIENLVNFINLFGDFVYQDEENSHLNSHVDAKPIKEIYDYFYEYIFWPRFNDKEKFESRNLPDIVIDKNELLKSFNDLVRTFDENIKTG